MSDYTLQDLADWSERIEKLAEKAGLSHYEQFFEICDYEEMLCYEAYVGMPSHYPHWSFGKMYERQRTFYQYNLVGLPYEMVINSNPCIAYLMRDNTLALQILTMAHVYAHNDFFKNNRLFATQTRAELTVEMFKNHANRVRGYISDPSIGPEKVERILDAAHALRYQIERYGIKPPENDKEKPNNGEEAIPKRLSNDLLGFLAEKGKLTDWERDLICMVRDESLYFLPQLETKIMNEGWASFWHYRLLQQLELPQPLHWEFLQRHNLVVRPYENRINPYFLGFKIFENLERLYGDNYIFQVRKHDRDQSFLRRHLTQELCQELNLFSYTVRGNDIIVKEVADEAGWKAVRDDLAKGVGLGAIPSVNPEAVEKGQLFLEHSFEGWELDIAYARETIKYVVDLWGGKVSLRTRLNGKAKMLVCTEDKVVSLMDDMR
ncbi:hypothetical protein P22_3729 [Propionispora sp. 2/2-37]|uniref:SpoVR family protein n=1 Tax=Propionispora sp. 2/2-37 TaxID=1677858 RepID=UPI0006BB9281|nr:SpoVR family protein [Propionispora sp. 2/2-37]CUH97598.1 hypothetical protein P22_3729 [Propionispora sp. 2/2-37]